MLHYKVSCHKLGNKHIFILQHRRFVKQIPEKIRITYSFRSQIRQFLPENVPYWILTSALRAPRVSDPSTYTEVQLEETFKFQFSIQILPNFTSYFFINPCFKKINLHYASHFHIFWYILNKLMLLLCVSER